MPLLEQLKQLSEPGNPGGVCALSSAVTAHALMAGPESLTGLSTLSLPLVHTDEVAVFNPQEVRDGIGPAVELDVARLEGGVAKVWKWKGGEDTGLEGGKDMINWLQSTAAKPGVYVGCVDVPGEDDEHFFNIAKTDEGKVYLVDASLQNFMKIKGPEDLSANVIIPMSDDSEDEAEEESQTEEVNLDEINNLEEEVPKVGKETLETHEKEEVSQGEGVNRGLFSDVYCTGKMKLDYCGPLHPGCAQELQQSLKRSLREDFTRTPKVTVSGPSQSITHL